jgi:hypothetical protein
MLEVIPFFENELVVPDANLDSSSGRVVTDPQLLALRKHEGQ